MNNTYEPTQEIKDIISKTINAKPKPDDLVFYLSPWNNDICSCQYKNFSNSLALLYFLSYDDAKACESSLREVNKQIEKEIIESMFGDMDKYYDIGDIKIGEPCSFELKPIDIHSSTCATHIEFNPIGGECESYLYKSRLSYDDIKDMNKVIAYYKGLEV